MLKLFLKSEQGQHLDLPGVYYKKVSLRGFKEILLDWFADKSISILAYRQLLRGDG